MSSFFGVPAHPLLVHIPVVLIPLAAIGVILIALKPSWRERYGTIVLIVALIGTLGAIFAAGAGEDLERTVGAAPGSAARARIEEHVEAGDFARTLSIVFFVVLAIWLLAPAVLRWWNQRKGSSMTLPTWAPVVLAVLSVVLGVAASAAMVRAGHTGASSVWCEVSSGGC